MNPELTAACDQDRAYVDDRLDRIVADIRRHSDNDTSEVYACLIVSLQWMADVSPQHLQALAAGALLRLAEGQRK